MQRILLLLVIGSLAAAAWFIAHQEETPDEGLVVHIYLQDRAGKAVSLAQVIEIYGEKRTRVDSNGYARITGVTLRAGEEPSAEALKYAFKPLAHYHAVRRGFEPTITQREDGAWDVHYALHPHGILRVHVESVALGKCKAYLERDMPLQRWEPVGGHAVVRTGSVVDFRIFEGWDDKLPVRLEGKAGPDGVPTVATQRLLIDPPSPGHTSQLRIVPEPVDPIAGVLVFTGEPTPPTLRGTLVVRRLAADGSPVEIGRIPIEDDGSFVVRDAGTAEYTLEAWPYAFDGPTTVHTKGGEYVELALETEAHWLVIKHPKLDLQGRAPRWWAQAPLRPGSFQPAPMALTVLVLGETETLLSIQHQMPFDAEDDYYRIALDVAGSAKAPPLRGTAEFGIPASGLPTGELTLEDVPHATVVVRMDPATWGPSTSARVEVDGQVATLVKGAKDEATFRHVACKPSVGRPEGAETTLAVEWNGKAGVPLQRVLLLDGGAREEIEVRRVEGGFLQYEGTGPGRQPNRGEDIFALLRRADGDVLSSGPPKQKVRIIRLVRKDSRLRWEAEAPLAPGHYDVRVVTKFQSWGYEAWTGDSGDLTFSAEIRAGETTTVKFKRP